MRTLDLGNPINRSHPLNRGLVSRWQSLSVGPHFGGLRLLDLCNRNHGTRTNSPAWRGAMGRLGGFGCLEYVAGSSRYVQATVTDTTNWTWATWVRHTGAAATRTIFARNAGNAAGVRLPSSHIPVLLYQTNVALTAANTAIPTDTWTHFAVTASWDGVNHNFAYYHNGRPDGTASRAQQLATNDTFYMGTRQGLGEYLTGNMDDTRVFSEAKTASEMRDLYTFSLQRFDPTLNWVQRRSRMEVGGGGGGGNRRRRVIMGASA